MSPDNFHSSASGFMEVKSLSLVLPLIIGCELQKRGLAPPWMPFGKSNCPRKLNGDGTNTAKNTDFLAGTAWVITKDSTDLFTVYILRHWSSQALNSEGFPVTPTIHSCHRFPQTQKDYQDIRSSWNFYWSSSSIHGFLFSWTLWLSFHEGAIPVGFQRNACSRNNGLWIHVGYQESVGNG